MDNFNNNNGFGNSIQYNTPIGNFSAHFDNLHFHSYPEHHNGNQMGANLNQIDLQTGRSQLIDSFEMNFNPFKPY